jgi:CheY-like chemotaxis protein
VVDDRKENRDVLGRMLAAVGCEVAFAESGEEAVAAAPDFRPDMVWIDLLMPGVDGMAAIRALASDERCRGAKLIAHTASPLARYREAALAAGCVAFLTKPIRTEQVHECLRTHFGADFECLNTQPQEAEALPPLGAVPIVLPRALHARLATAAELHSTTALKLCLRELRELGPESEVLAEHMRHLMRSYDMNGIQRLMDGATKPELVSAAPCA